MRGIQGGVGSCRSVPFPNFVHKVTCFTRYTVQPKSAAKNRLLSCTLEFFKKNVSNGTFGYVCMYEYVNAVGNIDMVQLHL